MQKKLKISSEKPADSTTRPGILGMAVRFLQDILGIVWHKTAAGAGLCEKGAKGL